MHEKMLFKQRKKEVTFLLLWGYPYVPYPSKMLHLEGRQNRKGSRKNEMAGKNA